jgi:hypothetical protein
VKFRYSQNGGQKVISTAHMMTVVIVLGTLTWGCSAGVPSGNKAMTTIEFRESDAAKWDSYSYDGWSSFYSPVTIVSTPPPARHKLSIYRSLQVIHDDREYVRSGYTDPRWVRVGQSDSELFPESQQVLELLQAVHSDGYAPAQARTNNRYDSFIEFDSGLREDLKTTTFIP